MHSRVYPNWEQLSRLKNPLTKGEEALLRYLDDHLPKDNNWQSGDQLSGYRGWMIFAQPFLNGSRPDIVIFNPFVGVVIYEVKDWDLSHYEWVGLGNQKHLHVKTKTSSHPIKHPVNQVNHYKEKIIGELVPVIGELMDKNKKNYGLVKTALYFHNASTKAIQEFFDIEEKSLKHTPVFGNDSLNENSLSLLVPDVSYTESQYWNREWNEELIFWFKPPFHSIEQGVPLTLKGNQRLVAEPGSGHHRVRGVAGSGKTQALAYRAARLASMKMDVLVITFNITLWHYIKDMVNRSPFPFDWERITFVHFHGFCSDKLNEVAWPWPKSPKMNTTNPSSEDEKASTYFFQVTVPNAVRTALEGKHYQKYDAVLIDEGQDYQYEWYSLLNDLFIKERDELLVVVDKKQNIYERELSWLDKRVNRSGLEKFRAPHIDLTSSWRMPERVAQMSNEFSELFGLNQELKVGNIERTAVLFHSQHIIWRNIEEEQWLVNVYDAFRRLQKQEYNPTDTVLLLPNKKFGQAAVAYFEDKRIKINHVFETNEESRYHPHKKAFWMGDSRLKICTIHSFKGWELLNIVLFIPQRSFDSNKKLDAMVYTAMTRTRENLIVLNAHERYREFGDKLPKNWDEQ